jgi:hypothetical protein
LGRKSGRKSRFEADFCAVVEIGTEALIVGTTVSPDGTPTWGKYPSFQGDVRRPITGCGAGG